MRKEPPSAASGAPPSDEERLGDVLDFMRLLWSIDHRLQSVSKRMAASLGITGPQRLVVRFVGLFPGVTSGRLSHLLHLHPSTLTGVVQRLQKAGLLERVPDPQDGRRALLKLKPAGRKLSRAAGPTVEAATQRALRRCSPSERAAARTVLQAVAQELDALNGGAATHGRLPAARGGRRRA